MIPLDVLHRVDHKMPRKLNIHILNTSSDSMPISKNTLSTKAPATKVENICNINWSTLDKTRAKMVKQVEDLPEI